MEKHTPKQHSSSKDFEILEDMVNRCGSDEIAAMLSEITSKSDTGTVRLRTEELVKIDRYTSDVLDEEKFRQEHHNYVVQEFAQRLGVSTEEAIRLYEELNSKFTD